MVEGYSKMNREELSFSPDKATPVESLRIVEEVVHYMNQL
jgi:hypothetical protein